MSYENREPPEEVNYSQDEPLRELAVLLAGATALVIGLVLALALAAGWLAARIPFETERALAEPFATRLEADAGSSAAWTAARARLQAIADRVATLQDLPPGMAPVVHLVDDPQVNAFATVGGHVIITRGILEKMPHENALVLLMAHEVAHVKHRDPVVALGRGVAVMTALAVVSGVSDSGALAGHLQGAGLLTTLRFNRGQERAADEEALRTLEAWYGHTAGAADLFRVIGEAAAGREPPAFLSTHPGVGERIARMEAAATPGAITPLPAVLRLPADSAH